MADTNNIKINPVSAVKAVEAITAPAKAIAANIDAATKPVVIKAVEPKTSAPQASAAKSSASKTVASKPARKARATTKRRAAKRPATVAATNNKRSVKATKRVAKATVAPASIKIERNTPMAYDFTKMFAGFELPAADRFQTIFADAGDRSQDMVRKSQAAAGEMTELAKANIEALTEAGRIAATGVRSIGQSALATSREGFEQASSSLKTLADAKSPTEFFQIQSDLAKASFDRVVAEGSKFAEAMVKLAGEAAQPLSNRATINAERINELAA